MPDPSAVMENDLNRRRDRLAADFAEFYGLPVEEVMVGFRDVTTLAERMEAWDMISLFIDGVELPVPDVGAIDGGDAGLFYRGYLNMVWGDDGHGKSLLIDQVTWVERRKGRKVMILESEELSPRTRVARWLDESKDRTLITAEDVAGVIVYPVNRKLSSDNVQMMATQIRNENISVVFVDSLGTLMANMGYNENDAKDCYTVKASLFDPLTEAGAAVVVVDHVTKSEGDKPKSIGSTRKRSMLSGVGFELRADETARWSRKRAGHAELRCWKDRQGGFNSSEHVATLWVTPTEIAGFLQLSIEAPEELIDEEASENRQPAVDVEKQLEAIHEEMRKYGPLTAGRVKDLLRLEFKKDAQALLDAGLERGWWMYNYTVTGYVLAETRL
jgi:hypothetical protein